MNLKEVERKAVSLSWLIISTRDYKAENDWYWDKKHHCCYGVPKKRKTDCVANDLWEYFAAWNKTAEYFDECVLMPELYMNSIENAKSFLIAWCNENGLCFLEDLNRYKLIKTRYWGYDDMPENDKIG